MATKQGTQSKGNSNAKGTGNTKDKNGSGVSKVPPTSAEQKLVKDASKARRVQPHDAKGRFTKFTKDTGIYSAVVHPTHPIKLSTREERAMAELLKKNQRLSEVPTQKSDLMDQLLKNFINEFGSLVLAKVVKPTWSQGVKRLVGDYITSLVKGDGSKPAELSDKIAGHIKNLFCGLCFKMIVGTDVLPGQRQQWYQSMFVKEPANVS